MPQYRQRLQNAKAYSLNTFWKITAMENEMLFIEQQLVQVQQLQGHLWGFPNQQQALAAAETLLNNLLAQFPENTCVLTVMGAVLCDNGRHEDALLPLRKAESIGSTDQNLYRNIGIALMNSLDKNQKEARQYFEKAQLLQSHPMTIVAYFDPMGY